MTVEFIDQSDITIDESSLDSLTCLCDMTSIGNNLWQHDWGTNYWNPTVYCALEDKHLMGIRSKTPQAQDEWDTVDGDANETSKLIVYSEDKPLVFASTFKRPVVFIKNCTNITVNVQAVFAALAVYVVNSDDVNIVVEADYIGRGVYISNSTNVYVHDSRIENAAQAGISTYLDCSGANIVDNRLHRCGLSESAASIYSGRTTGPVLVHKNKITDQFYGRYWQWDGSGLHSDHHTTDVNAYDNTVMNCHHGIHDNSGSDTNRFHHNLIVDNEIAYKINDTANTGNGPANINDNVLVNTPDGQGGGRNIILQTGG